MIAIREGVGLADSQLNTSITHVNFYTNSITALLRLEAIETSSKLTLKTLSQI
jgi:hypothetical protein